MGASAFASCSSLAPARVKASARTELTASANCRGSSNFCCSLAIAARSSSRIKLRSAASFGSPSCLGSTVARSWSRLRATSNSSTASRLARASSGCKNGGAELSLSNRETLEITVSPIAIFLSKLAWGGPLGSGSLGAGSVRLRRRVLVQASGNFNEQPGQQTAVGFDMHQFSKHPLDGRAHVIGPAPALFAQRLRFVAQSLSEVPVLAGQLVGDLAQVLLQSLDLFPKAAAQLLVRLCAKILFLANLAGERFQLFLHRRLHALEGTGGLCFQLAHLL